MTDKKSLKECGIGFKNVIQLSKLDIYYTGEWVDLSIKACKQSEPKVSFKEWFNKKFGNEIGYSTAMKYRRIYKTCVGHPDWVLTFSLSTLHDLCAQNCPEDLRKYLFENGNPDCPNTAYKQVIQGIKKGIYDLESPEVQAICRFDEKRAEFVERKKVDRSLIVGFKNVRAIVTSLSEDVEKSSLSEEGKQNVIKDNENITERINIQFDTIKNQSDPPEFHLPKDK